MVEEAVMAEMVVLNVLIASAWDILKISVILCMVFQKRQLL